MEKPPAYLMLFLLRIRRHSGELGYLNGRFADMPMERMEREAYMLHELHRLGFIALPDERAEKVYDPHVAEIAPGLTVHRAGTEVRVPYPETFVLLPAGHYLLRELAVSALGKVSWTLVAAFLGGVIAVAVGNLG